MVRWHADPEIFGEIQYDPEKIEHRLRELAYLNKGLTLTFTNLRDPFDEADLELEHGVERDKKNPRTKIFCYPRGLVQYVEHLNETKDALHKAIYFSGERDTTMIEVALQYSLGYSQDM